MEIRRVRVSEPALVFVHSPLVGPLTWRGVADRCGSYGWRTVVTDLTGALAGPPPYQPAIATAVAEAAEVAGVVDGSDQPIVLIGHSGAGPLLPGIAARLGAPVAALIYVDAGLPYPGRTWFETAPADLVDRLHGLALQGWLPPWHEWFAPEVLATVLPEPGVRDAFTSDLRPLPLAYFQEPMPAVTWQGPAGYLLLSEGYRDDATRAAQAGMPVVEHPSHHLAMVTDPEEVARRLRGLLSAVGSAPPNR
jgi:pimeloyl-ACP methyl ester carboxylesterase